MYFERRDLPVHANPVTSSELRKGEVYFAVNYVDDEMQVPVIRTLVFIGKDLEPQDSGQVYFQDVESYREGFRYGSEVTDEWARFETGSENEVSHIFHYERALEELMRCSLRRNRAEKK
jgi:hypothetical protein